MVGSFSRLDASLGVSSQATGQHRANPNCQAAKQAGWRAGRQAGWQVGWLAASSHQPCHDVGGGAASLAGAAGARLEHNDLLACNGCGKTAPCRGAGRADTAGPGAARQQGIEAEPYAMDRRQCYPAIALH